jgi:hypothetical protein
MSCRSSGQSEFQGTRPALGEMFVSASTSVDVPDKTITSKRTGGMVIVLANDTGKLVSGEKAPGRAYNGPSESEWHRPVLRTHKLRSAVLSSG